VMPEWVGLVLGRDFNSRGMETCRGSIPSLWRLFMGVVNLFGLTGTRIRGRQ
jgi:hypothetical protein